MVLIRSISSFVMHEIEGPQDSLPAPIEDTSIIENDLTFLAKLNGFRYTKLIQLLGLAQLQCFDRLS